MNNYIHDLKRKSAAGDIKAQTNLLFRTRNDLEDRETAAGMACNLKQLHLIFNVMYHYLSNMGV